jgi:probable phosphoglycerate mutase
MHLYLIRHGQSYVNLPDWDGSKLDEPLTELGEKQATAAATWIATNLKLDLIFSSDMRRARQTAETISEKIHLPIQFDVRLREVGMNAPSGQPLPEEALRSYIDGIWGTMFPYDPITENGENWMQFRSRVGSFIDMLKRTYVNDNPNMQKRILVVCHGGVIEAFYEYIFQKGPWSVISVVTHNTGLTHFEYQPRPNRPDWRLYYQNRLEHLTPDTVS